MALADDVYTLEHPGTASANINTAATMYVSQPVMRSGLDGTEVVVALDNNKRTVLKGVRWAGPPFRSLAGLSCAFTAF